MLMQQLEDSANFSVHDREHALCVSPASFWVPDLINLSAWIEHAPFAFWLLDATSPQTLVELGVHYGYSYFAFCQAVQQLGLPTRCYAIDTWHGDEHSGFYGEEVYQQVHAYNRQKYTGFSQLIRSTFADALEYFLDQSIDILHIDGRHFYADVKDDFESWLPKLSDRAVVLFHDTNVKEKHFSVFKYWQELCQIYPHFEFIHGHGLGVLGVGKNICPKLKALFDSTNKPQQAKILHMYSRLGAALTDRYHLMNQSKQEEERPCTELVSLKEKLQENESHVVNLTEKNSQQQAEIIHLNNQLILSREKLQENESCLFNLTEKNSQQQIEIIHLKNQLDLLHDVPKKGSDPINLKDELETNKRQILQLKNQLSITESALKQRETIIEQLGQTMREIYSSKFWRFTWPLRKLFGITS